MLKINIKDMKKYYGTRLILDIEELKIYEGDKIGIVGVNGVGKTTLLEIINKNIDYDSGELFIDKVVSIKYIFQLGEPDNKRIGGRYASIFQVSDKWDVSMSGGEKTRFKLAEGLESGSSLIMVDEPTSNLDISGIELIINNFKEYRGTLLLVSHDRNLLDQVCNKILEIDNGKCKIYNGDYSKYLKLKEEEISRKEFEYEEFIKEKNRLTNLKRDVENRSAKVKTTPGRMGRSEEHTSELQSRFDIVCRLLLEKKNEKENGEIVK